MKNTEDQQCRGKMQYKDALSAKIALAKQGRAGRLGPHDKMSIYQCKFCGLWHMGHSDNGQPWYLIWS